MRLIRLGSAIGLALIMAVGLAFASGTAEGAAGSALESVDPTGATVVYWHQHSRAREDALNKMIAEFNATNAYKITVKGEYAGRYGDIYNKMITAIAGGTKPDLVVAYQNNAAAYQVSDALVDLNPYVSDKKWGLGDDIKDFFEGFIGQDVNAQFGGQRLGFPPNRSMEVVYYNRTWMQETGTAEAPATWDAFFEACRKATDKAKGTYGYAISTDASNIFAQVISRGGEIAKKDGSGYTYNTPEMKASMQFMKRLYDAGYSRKIGERYGDQTDFGNRKVMFTMSSTSGPAVLRAGRGRGQGRQVRLERGGDPSHDGQADPEHLRRFAQHPQDDAAETAGGLDLRQVDVRAEAAGADGSRSPATSRCGTPVSRASVSTSRRIPSSATPSGSCRRRRSRPSRRSQATTSCGTWRPRPSTRSSTAPISTRRWPTSMPRPTRPTRTPSPRSRSDRQRSVGPGEGRVPALLFLGISNCGRTLRVPCSARR